MTTETPGRVLLTEAEAVGSPYLTLAEAAAYCRRAPGTLMNAKCKGKLKAVRPGKRSLYTRAELDRWLREG